MRARRKFEPDFKAKVVLELLRGEKTTAQLCREHELAADQIGQWRTVVVERAHELFAEPASRATPELGRIVELERLAGQQALELAVLKKASNWALSRSPSGGS